MNGLPCHIPVLLDSVVSALAPAEGEVLVDCTLGLGGHSEALLDAAPCTVVGLDRDPWAVRSASDRLSRFGGRFIGVHASFSSLARVVDGLGLQGVHGVLADLGVSSPQLDDLERGFSFRGGPLDMRMDTTQSRSAAHVVHEWSEDELAETIRTLGEERHARRIARAIVAGRPYADAAALAEVVARAAGPTRKGRIHSATRTFQAIRMVVNDELGELRLLLPAAVERLLPGGRLAIISFHSLEDRIVKQFIAEESNRGTPRDAWGNPESPVRLASRPKVIRSPSDDPNPRSRSARLRTAVRLP